jgi:hypothetical protein
MINSASQHIGWLAVMLLLPVMFAIYRSYRLYFTKAVESATRPLTMSAAVGARS